MRVLVVEDEAFLAEAVRSGLRKEGIAADIATDGEMALESVAVNDYGVVVLDRDLPGVHGDDICRHNAVRITISTLRRKLGDPPTLHTATRVGYNLGETP